jgi:hypothetical protein
MNDPRIPADPGLQGFRREARARDGAWRRRPDVRQGVRDIPAIRQVLRTSPLARVGAAPRLIDAARRFMALD